MDKNYAFVVESDVFHTISLSDSLSIGQRWMTGLESNPIFIKTNLFPEVCAGTIWDGNYFYLEDNPEASINPSSNDILSGGIKYSGIVNGVVFGSISFLPEDFPSEIIEMLDAAMQSDPVIIQIPGNVSVDVGWTWNGIEFNPPSQE